MSSNSYVVVLRVCRKLDLVVGSLGKVSIEPGYYLYIGSANIKRYYLRVLRHFTKVKKLRWHIDYLSSNNGVEVTLGICCYEGLSEDSLYKLVIHSSMSIFCSPYIKGFGCSDTSHLTHLFKCNKLSKVLKEIIKYFSSKCKYVEIISS